MRRRQHKDGLLRTFVRELVWLSSTDGLMACDADVFASADTASFTIL